MIDSREGCDHLLMKHTDARTSGTGSFVKHNTMDNAQTMDLKLSPDVVR